MGFEPPTDEKVGYVVEMTAAKTIKFLRKKAYLQEVGEDVPRPDLDQPFQDHSGMTDAMAASIQSKIAFGERAGQKVRRLGSGSGFGYEEETPLVKGTQCAMINGFNLHAKDGVAAFARDRLLQHIKCVSGPPIYGDDMEIMSAVQDTGEFHRVNQVRRVASCTTMSKTTCSYKYRPVFFLFKRLLPTT